MGNNQSSPAPQHRVVGCRPPGVTKYMWKKYLDDFRHPCQFWTSEDGDACEIVILPSDDSLEIICREFDEAGRLMLNEKTVRCGFVRREYVGAEFFDGGYQKRGCVWRISDKPTPFPVHIVDPHEASNTVLGGTQQGEQEHHRSERGEQHSCGATNEVGGI